MPKADNSLQLLRSYDYARYLSVLFAPSLTRNALAAIYNFQREIIHVTRQVKEPLLAEMRLHYWQEALSNAINKPGRGDETAASCSGIAQTPIIKSLSLAIKNYKLSVSPFLNLCKAASVNLYQEPVTSRTAFEGHCFEIYGEILKQACRVLEEGKKKNLNREEKDQLQKACFHGGAAEGVAALISHLPHSVKQRKISVPQDILASLSITEKQLYEAVESINSEKSLEIIKNLSEALCSYFYDHYKLFREAEEYIPAFLRPAFLPLSVLPAFIKQIERRPEFLFRGGIKISFLRQQSRIFTAALFNRF